MGFRTLEINKQAEIHIKEGQLEVTTEDGIAIIPIEDLSNIMIHGANIRLSTMDLSILYYGYAVIRSSIARNLVATGFHPTFGIHHNSQLNAFNLADDLIEPYRAIVDAVACKNTGNNAQLSKNERREIASVLHNACMVNGTKINMLSAIELMCESLKRIVLEDSHEPLTLPTILPIERMEGITE